MGTDISFSEVVAAIMAHHAKLYELLLSVFPAYRGEGEMPPRENRASRILDCEKNNAHRLLEELATAAKAKRAREHLAPARLLRISLSKKAATFSPPPYRLGYNSTASNFSTP